MLKKSIFCPFYFIFNQSIYTLKCSCRELKFCNLPLYYIKVKQVLRICENICVLLPLC